MKTKKGLKTVPIHPAAQQAVNTPPGRNPELMRRLYQFMKDCRQRDALSTGARHELLGREAILAAACAGILPEDTVVVEHAVSAVRRALSHPRPARPGGAGGESATIVECRNPEAARPLASGILLSLGVGAALARTAAQQGGVVVTICGDPVRLKEAGEFLRLSAFRKLPLVAVTEHNMALRNAGGHSSAAIEKAARTFGVPGMIVDGSDVLAVYRVMQEALYRARHRGGPTLIECKTWRPARKTQAPPARVRHWVQGDPIEYMERQLKARGFWPA